MLSSGVAFLEGARAGVATCPGEGLSAAGIVGVGGSKGRRDDNRGHTPRPQASAYFQLQPRRVLFGSFGTRQLSRQRISPC